MNKIIFIGPNCVNKFDYAHTLLKYNDSLSLSATFTTNPEYKDKLTDNNIYYMNAEEVNLAFKNNVIFYISTNDYISHGIMMDSFYSDDIFVINNEDFNNIPDHLLNNNDLLIIWLDTKKYDSKSDKKREIAECKYLLDRLTKFKYMYFLDESTVAVSAIINEYLQNDETRQNEIIEENM